MKINYSDLNKIGNKYKNTAIRQLREPLLKAFDIYKSNINYGVEVETVIERAEIIEWYKKLLDKDVTAFESVPVKIQKYIK